jgi:Fic family protein
MSTTITTTVNRDVGDVSRREAPDALTSPELTRIRAEYLEMPGLVLTLPQASRLWGISLRRSQTLLSALVSSGFLVRDKTRVYRRPIND